MQDPSSSTAPTPMLDDEAHLQRPPQAATLRYPGDSECQTPVSRVCDNCIWKKVKCDLRRPTCSRCSERGYTCIYSSNRRRPGPPRGSRRQPRRPRRPHEAPDRNPSDQRHRTQGDRSSLAATTIARSVASCDSGGLAGSESCQDVTSRTECSLQPEIRPEEEERLFQKFLDVIHDSVPIFSKAPLLPYLGKSQHGRDLISTIVIITAKLTQFTFASDGFDPDSRIDLMLSSGPLQEDLCVGFPSLNQFRKACLIAFYEFHQFPGQQAWMRIGNLTRVAYWLGLDRLDKFCSHDLEWGSISQDDVEEWRLMWWFVYRLDSYVNLSSGTPYLIDEKLLKTTLLCDGHESQQRHPRSKLLLPSQPNDLWQLIPTIIGESYQTSSFNIHIITATATRQAGRVLQLDMLDPTGESTVSAVEVERLLSAIRLSLPTHYFNPMRNALLNETGSDHHARLVPVLHLFMARLLVSLRSCARLPEGNEWLLSWQQVLETCQDIASISEQWNGRFSLSVDPAISFIIFTALIFVDLHKKFHGASEPTLQSRLEHCETVLLLLLEQFARSWTLPRLLILSFKSFKELLIGPLLYYHVQSILSRFEAPLHPRWMQFLSSAHIQPHNHTNRSATVHGNSEPGT